MLGCDFFTVETAWLKTLYGLCFIELGTRRVHFASCTEHPTAEWVTQQARQVTWQLQDEQKPIKFLIRDRDAKFPRSFDRVFASENIKVVKTPFRTPIAALSCSAREYWTLLDDLSPKAPMSHRIDVIPVYRTTKLRTSIYRKCSQHTKIAAL